MLGACVGVCFYWKSLIIDLSMQDREAVVATTTGTVSVHDSSSPLLVGSDHQWAVARRGRYILAALYGLQVFYSFFIM